MNEDRCTQDKARRAFQTQAVFTTAFSFLTGGVFLSGLAMYMGGNELLVGYMSLISNICGIAILFFAVAIERFNSLKKVAICLTLCSKLVTVAIVFIPLLVSAKAQIAVFIPMVLIAFALQAQTTVVLNNWLVAFAEKKRSGQYIAKRQKAVLAVTVVLTLAGGRLMEAVSGRYIGFLILFAAALVMAIVEMAVLLRIPDCMRLQKTQKWNLCDMLRIPVQNRAFTRFVAYIFLFYLSLTIADCFTVLYMMRYLELSYATTTFLQLLISLPQLFLLKFWGKVSDQKGHRFALIASVWFFAGETVFLALSNPQNYMLCIPIAFLFASVANAGFVVGVFNRRYELMPKEGRILYDNFYSAAIGLAFVLGPLIGEGIKQLLQSGGWAEAVMPLGSIRMLYVLSTLAILSLQLIVCGMNRGERRRKA